ncbi:MAG: phosphatase [Eubacteriales bacterium]|nr:phosphatase [Eubacteriales bacterium]
MRLIADTHAHTIASGHAYSTLREMAYAASQNGLEVLSLTEHAPEMPGSCQEIYFRNLSVIPREMYGVKLLLGSELNIMNPEGELDLSEAICKNLDLVIASIHSPCYGFGHSVKENTNAYVEVMKKPYVDIIGHPDDGRFPIDYEVLVRTAKETKTLLEINNSSLRPGGFRKNTRENVLQMLELCKQYEVSVTTGSDAHIDVDAGNFEYVKEVLEYCKFPEELVVSTEFNKLKGFLNNYKES